MSEKPIELLEHVADIVTSYLANNRVGARELPELISSVYDGLTALSQPPKETLIPAVDPKRSVKADHIVCLEDGKRFKSLRRHLGVEHGMTPDEYRTKWGLSAEYPMVAPNYAAARSELAKAMGLGRKRKKAGRKRT